MLPEFNLYNVLSINKIFVFMIIEYIYVVILIQHEFGHGFGYHTFGLMYNNWDNGTKENWAIAYTNWSYRIPYGIKLERYIYK